MVYCARFTIVAAAAVALMESRPAFAQGPEAPEVPRDPHSEALSLGEEGLRRFQGAHWKEAYALFRRADTAAHAPTLVLYMAHCQARLGELGAARRLYRAVAREHLADDAPVQFRTAQRMAAQELHWIEPRVSPLSLVVARVPEQQVRVVVDGEAVPPDQVDEVALDPGEHVVEASAPGWTTIRRTVQAAAGRPVALTLVFEPAPIAPVVTPPVAPPPPVVVPPKGGPTLLTGAAIAFGTGGVSLTVGIITGAVSLGAANSLKAQCPASRCPASDAGTMASIGQVADTATGTLVVGAIALAVGVTLAVVHPRGPVKPATLRLGPGFAAGVF
jgi:hypothetical protein